MIQIVAELLKYQVLYLLLFLTSGPAQNTFLFVTIEVFLDGQIPTRGAGLNVEQACFLGAAYVTGTFGVESLLWFGSGLEMQRIFAFTNLPIMRDQMFGLRALISKKHMICYITNYIFSKIRTIKIKHLYVLELQS
ncbi:hypothetical protein ACJX0J_026439, partial [Zea mays]